MPSSAANTKGRGYEGSAARKIHGTHSTIIGGREGKRLLLKVAGSPLTISQSHTLTILQSHALMSPALETWHHRFPAEPPPSTLGAGIRK